MQAKTEGGFPRGSGHKSEDAPDYLVQGAEHAKVKFEKGPAGNDEVGCTDEVPYQGGK